jgi:hypothetical protein
MTMTENSGAFADSLSVRLLIPFFEDTCVVNEMNRTPEGGRMSLLIDVS